MKSPKVPAESARFGQFPWGLDRPRTHLSALKARVKVRGLAAIDRRTWPPARSWIGAGTSWPTSAGRPMRAPRRSRCVEVAARTRLYLDHVDAHLMALPTLVNRRRKLLPLVEQRQRLADSLVRTLSTLGLERRPPKPVSLTEYLQTPRDGPPAAEEATDSR